MKLRPAFFAALLALTAGAASAAVANITVQLLGVDGRVVGQAVTDLQGWFAISAPPGRYHAQALVPKITRCPSPQVDLPRSDAGLLVIDCDNGRR